MAMNRFFSKMAESAVKTLEKPAEQVIKNSLNHDFFYAHPEVVKKAWSRTAAGAMPEDPRSTQATLIPGITHAEMFKMKK